MKKHSEIKDLIIAWLAISFCFTIALGNYSVLDYFTNRFSFTVIGFFTNLALSLLITATSFIVHELAHKYTAIHFGAQGQFVVWLPFLALAIVFSGLFGFIFVAPGAVYIFGKTLTIKEDGIISVAGPVANLSMGVLFFIAGLLNAPLLIVTYGVGINLWIAFFNLLPFGPLDGKKILTWNPLVWGLCIAIPILLLFVV